MVRSGSVKHETIPAVVQDLMKGRQRIVENWAKGCGLNSPSDGYCAVSAIDYDGSRSSAHRLLNRSLPEGQRSIHRYNDHPTTTKQDILDLYDRAIALALNQATIPQSAAH